MIRLHPLFGILIWLLFLAAWRPQFHEPRWIIVLLLFSPLVLMPLSRSLRGRTDRELGRQIFDVPAAALLAPAFSFQPGWLTALISLPWLILCGATALEALKDWRRRRPFDIAETCLQSSRVFPAIGAVWLTAERLGWNPFGYDSLIVLLTAAHFHHAGFTLPLIAGLHGRERPGAVARIAGLLILAGVPLVAVGIALTHAAVWRGIEPWAVAVLALGSLVVAALQVGRALDQNQRRWQRITMGISGFSLAAAMVLALGYGMRSLWPAVAFSMPSLWAVHGTLNVFGFGLFGILAWRSLAARAIES
ncbi:MAG: YndJ family transporter [Prosthecobacter sp.]|nr:YndJ family transporter [Prosthecobacter sp.]